MATAARPVSRRRLRLSNRNNIRIRRYGLRGLALVYLGAMIIVPVVAIIQKGFADGMDSLRAGMASPGAWDAIWLTLGASAAAAVINGIFGTMIAYALVRYTFRGRDLLDTIVDLPLAIPTLVTGVMLLVLYQENAPVGRILASMGIEVVGAKLGVLLALLVVTLPFTVRTVQPVLLELDIAEEEAAATLGGSPWIVFRKIVLPALRPAVAAGALLVFARSLGEFGSVVLISGNLTGRTLTAPVFIYQLASQFKPEQAAAVATVLFAISFLVVLATTRLIYTRREEHA